MSLVPGWVADERLARAAWSRLVEPPDGVALAVVEALGASESLRRVITGQRLLPEGSHRPRLTAAVARWRVRLEKLQPERDVGTVERSGGRVVIPSDPEWPERLADLQLAAPVCLWVRGEPPLGPTLHRAVAVVGTRSPSEYGRHVAGDLAAGVGDRGLAVVSGAALGIDGSAHQGALAVGAPTVAVLACGVDRFYPEAHAPLLRQIADEGLVVSEQAPGASPMKHRFLARNRLIAGLSQATVVVEAPWRSGAISTARRAAEIGREVGAVPGPTTSPMSAGCHQLMREGVAQCVTDADEVVELTTRAGAAVPPPRAVEVEEHDGLDPAMFRVMEALPVRRGSTVEALSRVAGLTSREVSAALGRLELAGLADRSAGPSGAGWVRRRPTRSRPVEAHVRRPVADQAG